MHPTDRGWRHSAAALLLATAALAAFAADMPCSDADKAVDRVTSWAALQKAVQDYGRCDKGTTADVFTEAILRVIIGGWSRVGEAGPILDNDAAFRNWLTRRLSNPSLPTQDSGEIRELAKASCPKGHDKVCAELLSAVEMGRAMSAPDLILLPVPATPAPTKGKP